MHLKHLRYFLAVAEERNFTHAADRVHIEPSPLSKAVKEFEGQLGVQLLLRAKGNIQLTRAGVVLVEEARNIMAQVENAKKRVQSASRGFQGQIRVGLSDGLASLRFAQLLALCREEEPNTEVRIQEMTLSELNRALRCGRIDIGFTIDSRRPKDININKVGVWCDQFAVALPIRHPLLAHSRVPCFEALRYPLITYHPEHCAGGYHTVRRMLGKMMRARAPNMEEYYVSGCEQMLLLVAAGYGIAIGLEAQLSLYKYPDVSFVRLKAKLT
jgi:DNA-binding transcriptional LysR family regulator